MSFNPDPSKPDQEIIFSRKLKKIPILRYVLIIAVSESSYQKHLGIFLET